MKKGKRSYEVVKPKFPGWMPEDDQRSLKRHRADYGQMQEEAFSAHLAAEMMRLDSNHRAWQAWSRHMWLQDCRYMRLRIRVAAREALMPRLKEKYLCKLVLQYLDF
jgi:hypothetical protein